MVKKVEKVNIVKEMRKHQDKRLIAVARIKNASFLYESLEKYKDCK